LLHVAPEIATNKGTMGTRKIMTGFNAYTGEINNSVLALAAASQAGINARHQIPGLMADIAATSHEHTKKLKKKVRSDRHCAPYTQPHPSLLFLAHGQ
jgi:hypothetical protein